jgi:hypothetical protein
MAQINALLVNWTTGTVLKNSGVPYIQDASCRQQTLNVESIVLNNRQARTFKEYLSTMVSK